MSYELLDKSGQTTYRFHSDRDVCDDTSCPCDLPSEAQQHARDRAAIRNDWFVHDGGRTGQGSVSNGPYSEADARSCVETRTRAGAKRIKLLRVVEDYDA